MTKLTLALVPQIQGVAGVALPLVVAHSLAAPQALTCLVDINGKNIKCFNNNKTKLQ
jgi:hypothetical protein